MNGCVKNGLRGALIVFEGCDRSGKSTQCAKLAEKLISDGRKVALMKFPDRTTVIGQMINNYLQQTEELDDRTVHLLFSANRWEAMQSMARLLHEGTTIIADRYAFSGVAYSAAKGLDIDWCHHPDVGLIQPDKVFYLTVGSDRAAERAQFGTERYEKHEFQQKVHNLFLKLQEAYWQTVDGEDSIDAIHKEIYLEAVKTIKTAESSPLLKLWRSGTFDV